LLRLRLNRLLPAQYQIGFDIFTDAKLSRHDGRCVQR